MLSRPRARPLIGLALLALAGATPLAASAGQGWYIGLDGGINFVYPQDFNIYGYGGQFGVQDGTLVGNARFKTGWLFGAATGYSFDNGLRPELEFGYRRNDFNNLSRSSIGLFGGAQTGNVGGFESTDTAMFNLWYDFFRTGWFHPYLGAGIGAARVSLRDPHYDQTQLENRFDVVFAYQGGGGVAFDLSPHWTASVDYRHLDTQKSSFDLVANTPNSVVKATYRANSAVFSLRYSFGGQHPPAAAPEAPVQVVPTEQPAPPPPLPAPPPCQPPAPGQPISLAGCKTGDTIVLHGVNFNFNKATLTVNAKSLLDQVADALLARKDIKVEIDGHTDGIGSGPYNLKLSDRRAASVKQYLIGRGIDAERMSSRGFGKTMPIADNSTDEGRELNRRVELKITDANPPEGTAAPEVAAPPPEAAAPAPETPTSPTSDATAQTPDAAAAPAVPAEEAPKQ